MRKWPCLAFEKATNNGAMHDNFTYSILQILVIKLIISTSVTSLHGTLCPLSRPTRLLITSTGRGLAGWQLLSLSRSTPPARQTTQQTQSVNFYTIIH